MGTVEVLRSEEGLQKRLGKSNLQGDDGISTQQPEHNSAECASGEGKGVHSTQEHQTCEGCELSEIQRVMMAQSLDRAAMKIAALEQRIIKSEAMRRHEKNQYVATMKKARAAFRNVQNAK